MWEKKLKESKTQNVTILKKITKLKNSNWDKTQKLKLWQNEKTWTVTKLKKSNCHLTKKNLWWQKSYCDKLKKLNCDKTQIVTVVIVTVVTVAVATIVIVTYFSKTNLTTQDIHGAAFCVFY